MRHRAWRMSLLVVACLGLPAAVGQENDDEWREYIHLGDEKFKKCEYAMAEQHYLEAHRLAQVFDVKDSRRAYTAVKIADLYARDDRRPKARTLYEQASKVFTEHQDDGLEMLGYCEKQLADLDSFEGKFASAVVRYQNGLEILKVLDKPDDPNTFAMIFGLARAFRHLGKLDASKETFDKLLVLIQSAEKPPENIGQILCECALLFWQKGNLARADALLNEAYSRGVQQRGELHREIADILSVHSELLQKMNRDDHARALAEKARHIYAEAH